MLTQYAATLEQLETRMESEICKEKKKILDSVDEILPEYWNLPLFRIGILGFCAY